MRPLHAGVPRRDLIERRIRSRCAGEYGELCKDCLRCAEVCPGRAYGSGKDDGAAAQKDHRRDRSLYDRTGGGVTLSGGEVLVQWEFAQMLCGACASAGINVCVESALNCPEEHMRAVLSTADLVITDIKHMDPDVHRSLTGSGNERILSNIKCLHAMGKKPVIRTPSSSDTTQMKEISGRRAIAEELHGEILAWQLCPSKTGHKNTPHSAEYPMSDCVPPGGPVKTLDHALCRHDPKRSTVCPLAGSSDINGDVRTAAK